MPRSSIYKIFRSSILFFCFFFYLYAIQFNGIPATTRLIMSAAGLALLIFAITRQAEKEKNIFISKSFIRYLFLFLGIVLISACSLVINETRDPEFIKYPLSIVLILLAAYFIQFLIVKLHGEINYRIVFRYLIAAVFTQVVLALIMFMVPAVSVFLQNIQNSASTLDSHLLEETGGFRLNGFGSTFFSSGIINGFALICIAFLLKDKTISKRRIISLAIQFLIIFVLGMMMARTTLIGFILAIVFLLKPSFTLNRKVFRNTRRFFWVILLAPLLIIFTLITVFPKASDQLVSAANFGFELFINYYNKGEFTSKSTNALQTMYVYPDNAKTYIIGDGKYYNTPGNPSNGYYKGTDVGMLRLIYYFGIIGLVCYLLLQFAVVDTAIRSNKNIKHIKLFFLFAFLYCIILNFKGTTDLFYLITLFCYPVHKIQPPYV